ncbi:MAG: hydantoinase/oxoprolinase family protein [Trueperaceae bacterium]
MTAGRPGGFQVGLDIGGTFTDLVLLDRTSNQLQLHKCLTTPQDPAVGALQGLQELLAMAGVALGEVDALLHGTTLVTNAIIERRGRPTGLLTTSGFRDVLEMGHEQRYDIYDLFLRYPAPIVPRRHRLELSERLDRDGQILTPLDLEQVDSLVDLLVNDGVEALAVCLLHSYRNPQHERLVLERVRERHPSLYVSASCEVVPEIREYERTNTTACNAYVQPLMDKYLARIEGALAEGGFQGRFSLMLSSGGIASPEVARRYPIRLLESGPAGGALATAYLGRRAGEKDLLAFDMGGTTAKACLIQDGRPDVAAEMEAGRVHRFKRGSGLPIRAPVVDMIEIGAGGGSIARRDQLGLLKVGPQSASADPGPACYGRGGSEPTVTDACLLLGYYDPEFFLGGSMRLAPDASRSSLEALGSGLGMSAVEAAWGVHQVVCESMARAARVHIIEKDQDPRNFPLLAFGGAGPAHAARVARILGTHSMLVPPVSGVASALGFLVAPTSFEIVRSYPGAFDSLSWPAIAELYSAMEHEARELLERAGVREKDVRIERSVEARLIGQFHEIEVPLPDGGIDTATGPALAVAFDRVYAERYHNVLQGYRPMAMSWRLRGVGPEPQVDLHAESLIRGGTPAPKGTRQAYFPELRGFSETPVYARGALPVGVPVDGPAIVEERESTTVIPPGDRFEVDEVGNLRVLINVGTLSAAPSVRKSET